MINRMKGVHFVTDAEGKKIAVQLDLKEWGELWEDIYDSMLVEERRSEREPTTPLEEFIAELERDGEL
jgi:hypothetical protein